MRKTVREDEAVNALKAQLMRLGISASVFATYGNRVVCEFKVQPAEALAALLGSVSTVHSHKGSAGTSPIDAGSSHVGSDQQRSMP